MNLRMPRGVFNLVGLPRHQPRISLSVDEVRKPYEVADAYDRALQCDGSYLIVENPIG